MSQSSLLAVNIAIESCDEFKVQEITYDGQEKCIMPLSMSEQMARTAERIDFSKSEEELAQEESSGNSLTTFQPSLWPWDSVRSKLRNSFTEITVLLDVLSIAKQKKYLVLDPVSPETSFEQRPQFAAIIAKKKALSSVSMIIRNGADRLASTSDTSRNRSSDFHSQLMQIRHNWRMKKAGNTIVGDLSFRSVGSRYPHSGTFEISKREDTSGSNTSAIKVTVPPDLEGVSYIHVSIQKSGETLASVDISIPIPPAAASNLESSWQEKLENAQNVLFCKELFAQLAREAVQVHLPISTIVMGNQIMATLFPGIQLCIVLCHTNPSSKKKEENEESISSKKSEHRPVLEHSLHQLLRDVHHRALHQPMPHPISATLGLSRKHYLAGPEAHDKHMLAESLNSDTSLEQIMSQAQHVILRVRVMNAIDSLAKEIQDPAIVAHWTCMNSPTKSSVKANIISLGYESLHRTPLVLHIGSTSVKATCRDGRVFNMSYESQEVRSLIQTQVSQHQVYVVQALAKMMGWKVLSFTINCGVGPIEVVGTASSLSLASPNGERIIALRHGPESGVSVSISSPPHEQVFYPSTLVNDVKWQNITSSFKEVALDRIEGRNLVAKMEFLMASLTAS